MRNQFLTSASIIVAALAIVAGVAMADKTLFGAKTQQGDLTRAPVPVAGSWTAIACTAGASASSAALNLNTRYWLNCPSAAYFETGDSSATATSSDGSVPGGAILEFSVDDTTRYIACLNVSSSEVALNGAGCKIKEVR